MDIDAAILWNREIFGGENLPERGGHHQIRRERLQRGDAFRQANPFELIDRNIMLERKRLGRRRSQRRMAANRTIRLREHAKRMPAFHEHVQRRNRELRRSKKSDSHSG